MPQPLKITASQEPGASHCFRIEATHWTLDPATIEAAHRSRRLEIDAWLKEQGAIRIKVQDLRAAFEAAYRGQQSIRFATRPGGWPPDSVLFAGSEASRAAHMARRSLGLGEGEEE